MNRQSPALSKDVSLFILYDVGIVFSESSQENYKLNTTATFIWCQLEEGLSEAEIAEVLAATFGYRGADAEHYVRAAILDWRSRRFLAGQPAASRSESRISASCVIPCSRPLPSFMSFP